MIHEAAENTRLQKHMSAGIHVSGNTCQREHMSAGIHVGEKIIKLKQDRRKK